MKVAVCANGIDRAAVGPWPRRARAWQVSWRLAQLANALVYRCMIAEAASSWRCGESEAGHRMWRLTQLRKFKGSVIFLALRVGGDTCRENGGSFVAYEFFVAPIVCCRRSRANMWRRLRAFPACLRHLCAATALLETCAMNAAITTQQSELYHICRTFSSKASNRTAASTNRRFWICRLPCMLIHPELTVRTFTTLPCH